MVEIPEQAVKAAIEAIDDYYDATECVGEAPMKAALTAAAPHMSGSAREQALEEAAQIVEVKLTQAMTGNSVVGRMLHALDGKLIREIAAAIRALKSQQAAQTGGGE